MSNSIRVFLAEDSRFAVRAFMRELKGWNRTYELEIATDGKAACDYFDSDEDAPDVAVLDIGMPKASGIDILRQIRESRRLVELPCIMLTTSESPRDKRICEALNANEYLVKGAPGRRIIEALERNINRFESSSLRGDCGFGHIPAEHVS